MSNLRIANEIHNTVDYDVYESFKLSNGDILQITHDDDSSSPLSCESFLQLTERSRESADTELIHDIVNAIEELMNKDNRLDELYEYLTDTYLSDYSDADLLDQDLLDLCGAYDFKIDEIIPLLKLAGMGYYFDEYSGYSQSSWVDVLVVDTDNTASGNVLNRQADEYAAWCCGDVFRFDLLHAVKCECCGDVDYKIMDSCGGFYGDNWQENGLFDQAGIEYKFSLG